MINNKEFTIRLQEMLTYYDLSAASFAEKMGVGRSSISHIMSGRNNPSLEFVLHLLENFEEVNFEWLMYGKGNFPKSKSTSTTLFNKPVENKEKTNTGKNRVFDTQPDLFSNTPANTDQEKTEENIAKLQSYLEIERIVIFYTNGIFKEYKN